MKWSHTILEDPSFRTEWQAQTDALRLSLQCGTIGDNALRSDHRQQTKCLNLHRQVSFSNDVTVLCLDTAASACSLTHCAHGRVQKTIHKLTQKLRNVGTYDVAPLSSQTKGQAVLSSIGDASSFMQTFPPFQHNEIDAPGWYPFEGAAVFEESSSETEDSGQSPGEEDDPEQNDNGNPGDNPEPHPPEVTSDRQSVIMFHMRDDPIHAMLHWVDFGIMMQEIAYHYGIDREDVVECHEVHMPPADIPHGSSPLIVQMVDDIPVGDIAVLILLDIEIHGQHMEAHYQVSPQVERQSLAVPARLTRHALLMRANVFEYCRLEHYRCLVEHNQQPWPQQATLPRDVKHGDYFKIKIPPPRLNTVCTADALDDSRQMTVADFWTNYYVSSSSEPSSNDEGVSPSLISSAEIREQFGRPMTGDDSDHSSLMRRPAGDHVPAAAPGSVNSYQASLEANSTCVLTFNPDDATVWPLWYRHLVAAFGEHSRVEHQDEGPVVYVNTWFVTCSVESTNEDSRIARLDTLANLWVADIQQLWGDKIQQGSPIFFVWVRPTPLASPLTRAFGHLIVYQFPHPNIVPVLLSFQFHALRMEGISHAVAAIDKTASPEHVMTLARFERVCRGRKCTFHRGAVGYKLQDPLIPGEGLKIAIPPPGGRPDLDLLLRSQAVALLDTGPELIVDSGLSLRLEDQLPFVQELHHRWSQDARNVQGTQERFLEVTTWYLDAIDVPYNDQSRPVLLGEDYFNWANDLRRVWHDLEDAGAEIEFALVFPTPAPSPLASIHILLHQHIQSDSKGAVITTYDNAYLGGQPFSAACVVPTASTATDIIDAARRPSAPSQVGVSCRVWYESLEITGARIFEVRHGVNLNIHIYRQNLHEWEDALDEHTLLQLHAESKTPLLRYPKDSRVEHLVDAEPEAMHSTPNHLKLNLSETISALNWFDTYFVLPAFDVELRLQEHAHWHPDTLPWLRAQWFSFDHSVDAVRIYYDGSFFVDTGKIGFAAAAFVRCGHDWAFAGAVSGSSDVGAVHGSYQAETLAANLAVKLLYDICKILKEVYECVPYCELVFDSLTVGRQSEGKWQSLRAVHACHLIRGVLRLCEERFQLVVEHQFCPSHRGEPGNELVDTLARCAAQGFPLQDWHQFFSVGLKASFVQAMEWAWFLFTPLPDVAHTAEGFAFPVKPSTRPMSQVIELNQQCDEDTVHAQITVNVATCNVLTLKNGSAMDDFIGCTGPARQEWILETLHQHGIHIFGLQETRVRKLMRTSDPRYILVKSPATTQGHFGMMIGLAKHLPHGQINGQDVFFSEDHYKIIAALPRCLILRVRSRALKCIIIAAHAPHTGATLVEGEQFWTEVSSHIHRAYDTWPKLLLTDANCRVGGNPDQRVGSWQSEGMHEKSQPFLDFLAIHDIMLPSTFEDFHHGPGGTWRHSDGQWKRNDFIGVSVDVQLTHCATWIPEEVDFSMMKEDHRPLFAKLSWNQDLAPAKFHGRKAKPAAEEFVTSRIHDLASCTPASFHLDVHSHAFEIEQNLLGCRHKRKASAKKPRKQTISESTWALIESKRQWRNTLASHQKLQHKTLLASVFSAWKQARTGPIPVPQVFEFDRLLSHQDRSVAIALHQFRLLGRKVSKEIRADDAAFFTSLASSVSEVLGPHQIRDFWKTIRRSLPKFRQRRLGQDPNRLETLQDQWAPYFQKLECGIECSPEDLVVQCHQRQMAMPTVQHEYHCCELPSLIEFEDALRATQADRATGLDPLPSRLFSQQVDALAKVYFPLLLKICMWQHEPISAKGGVMAVLYKRGSGLVASDYRGIMLLPTVAKRIHSLLRKRLMFLLAKQKPQGQLGGFPRMEVPYGSQLLRTFGHVMDAMGISSAILFVDLSNAFHMLVRELVSGVHVPQDVEAVLEQLLNEGIPVDDLIDLLQLPTLLQQLDVPPYLRQLIQDLHTHTWMQVSGSDKPIVTRKGTRPGSPLADCVFHILMADVTREINQVLRENKEFCDILARADVHVESVVWADDIALPIAAETASGLVDAIEHTFFQMHQIFLRRGFTFNMQKGKTSVVATFKGTGAPAMRARYQLVDQPGLWIQLHQEKVCVHFMPCYKHLGTMFCSDHALSQEIAMRIGTAKSAFAQIAKPILCNRHIPEHTRVRLFRSLIESRLFFGLGSWHTPPARQMAKLQAALLSMLRKLFRMSADEISTTTVNALFQRAGICSMRARLAMDRLLYAQRLWECGPEMLLHALHREEAFTSDSWLQGLKHDLHWLCSLDVVGVPALQQLAGIEDPSHYDLTELFDYWQSGSSGWKACVKRAWKRFHRQESMMEEIQQMHKTFFKTLKSAGATFEPDPFGTTPVIDSSHTCSCGRTFTSAQGLACHRRQQHGEYAQERLMIAGETCPECLKFFWTKQRLFQHLSYVSRVTKTNKCFQALKRRGFTTEPAVGNYHKFPSEVRGLARVETIQAQGPNRPLVDITDRTRADTATEIANIDAELDIEVVPSDSVAAREKVRSYLTKTTLDWFDIFCQQGYDEDLVADLPDRWLACLFQFEDGFDCWVEAEILHWGQHDLGETTDRLLDGVAERLIEEAFTEMAAELPRQQLLYRRAHLVARQKYLEEEQDAPFPHRPVRYGSANARERFLSAAQVPDLYASQVSFLHSIRQMKWLDLPQELAVPFIQQPSNPPLFVIAHLFSGRRRGGDVHERLHFWAERFRLRILVLSLDTANSVEYGNLEHHSVTWDKLMQLYQGGHISATITGSPCETWSAARHHISEDQMQTGRRFPRPLRDAERLLGRAGLTPRELRQLRQGTLFFMQSLITMGWTLVTGGLYISEHPAIPILEEAASVWKTPWVQLLCAHPEVTLHTVGQWRWGCTVAKPTGLLAIRLPKFRVSMYSRQDPHARYPAEQAIGVGEDGRFRTSAHKEYPEQFCNALAGTLMDEMERRLASDRCRGIDLPNSEVLGWLREASTECATVRATSWLPDYQGS